MIHSYVRAQVRQHEGILTLVQNMQTLGQLFEPLYKEQYLELNGTVITKSVKPLKVTAAYGKIGQLLWELLDDNDNNDDNILPSSLMHTDPQ